MGIRDLGPNEGGLIRWFRRIVVSFDVAEAQAYGDGAPARLLPCQALDHASGYFLATGILAALYHQIKAESRGGGD